MHIFIKHLQRSKCRLICSVLECKFSQAFVRLIIEVDRWDIPRAIPRDDRKRNM